MTPAPQAVEARVQALMKTINGYGQSAHAVG